MRLDVASTGSTGASGVRLDRILIHVQIFEIGKNIACTIILSLVKKNKSINETASVHTCNHLIVIMIIIITTTKTIMVIIITN